MTVRQLVALDLGVSKSRVSQYVKCGMPLNNAADAARWVRRNFRVHNWGEIINVNAAAVDERPSEQIRFVR